MWESSTTCKSGIFKNEVKSGGKTLWAKKMFPLSSQTDIKSGSCNLQMKSLHIQLGREVEETINYKGI